MWSFGYAKIISRSTLSTLWPSFSSTSCPFPQYSIFTGKISATSPKKRSSKKTSKNKGMSKAFLKLPILRYLTQRLGTRQLKHLSAIRCKLAKAVMFMTSQMDSRLTTRASFISRRLGMKRTGVMKTVSRLWCSSWPILSMNVNSSLEYLQITTIFFRILMRDWLSRRTNSERTRESKRVMSPLLLASGTAIDMYPRSTRKSIAQFPQSIKPVPMLSTKTKRSQWSTDKPPWS